MPDNAGDFHDFEYFLDRCAMTERVLHVHAGPTLVELHGGNVEGLYPKNGQRYTSDYSPCDTATSQSVCFEKQPEA